MYPLDDWIQGMHRLSSVKYEVAPRRRGNSGSLRPRVEDKTFSPDRCFDSSTAFLLLS